MDWLTAVVECVKALVWPIVIGILIVSQRDSLGKLIAGLKPKSAKGFGAEIDFEPKLEQVEDKVETAKEELIWPPKPDHQITTDTKEIVETADRLNEVQRNWEVALAAVSKSTRNELLPADLQIEKTWTRIEQLLEQVLNEDIDVPPLHNHPSVKRMLKLARDTNAIPTSVVDAIQELYSLRSKVVHTGYEALSESEAERFAEVAKTVEAMLEFFLTAARKVRDGQDAGVAKMTVGRR